VQRIQDPGSAESVFVLGEAKVTAGSILLALGLALTAGCGGMGVRDAENDGAAPAEDDDVIFDLGEIFQGQCL
jgi:hypothetical protein